ncbi:hypothetical protein CLU79DRAFT_586216 [Phycomyces nitens]|nr:hypothetical protein CLU79DRAFT_586216 [Phycomyces nitens]
MDSPTLLNDVQDNEELDPQSNSHPWLTSSMSVQSLTVLHDSFLPRPSEDTVDMRRGTSQQSVEPFDTRALLGQGVGETRLAAFSPPNIPPW